VHLASFWTIVRQALATVIGLAILLPVPASADREDTSALPPVRHSEGVVHGFLVLRTTDGARIADGDLIQNSRGDQVSTQLVFHFKDGSIHDERATFSQRGRFQLLAYHLVQKGKSFPQALDVEFKRPGNRVIVKSSDEHGKPQNFDESIDLPPSVANGIVAVLLKNVRAEELPLKWSMLATTPKPRLVTLNVTSAGNDRFVTGGRSRLAAHYVIKVEIGGLAGLVAPLLHKQPPDSHVWILHGEAPAFVKSEQLFYLGGPIWRIELTSPEWVAEKPPKSSR